MTVTPCLELMKKVLLKQTARKLPPTLRSQTNQESPKEGSSRKASKMLHLAQWSTLDQPWTMDTSPLTTPLDTKRSTQVSKVMKSLLEFFNNRASLKSPLLATQWPTGSIHIHPFPPPAS